MMSEQIEWYFDFISPFSYLQWRRLRRHNPALVARLVAKPVLLAGLLNHWGQLGPAELPGKRKHTYRMVLWQARKAAVPLVFPPSHPFNPLPSLRLCLAAPDRVAAIDAIFRHIWEHGRAGDSAEALAEVASSLGIADVAAAIADPAVKQQLADNGASAIAMEIFGVPTLVIDGQPFWGNDATEMALDYLANRALFDDEQMRRVDSIPAAVQRSRT
jgi:2-hydroxychromene-2-carboxylate isomerase